MKRLSLTVIVLLFCAEMLRAEGTLYVPSGSYPTIQSAIDGAGGGETIIVSAGRYQENINFLGKAITVRSVEPNNPAVVAATIIDGNEPADANNASVVTFNNGETNDSVLSGFTITGGTGSWVVVSWEFQGQRWNRCGGGVVCYNMSEPTISKNFFTKNSAGQGGGIYIYGNPVNPDDPSDPAVHISSVIIDNTFIDNHAITNHGFAPPDSDYTANDHGDGGAIVAFQGCDPIIKGNFLQNNSAEMYGGGIHLRQWSNGLLESNHIIDNNSSLGAGIHITYQSSPTIRSNLIEDNTATNLGGGGIYVYNYSNPTIEHNRITGNYSKNGSGIAVKYSSSPTIRSNLIDNNLAGSAIACTSTSSWIHHNTIINNQAFGAVRGAGIECTGTNYPRIENNIIASTTSGYGIYLFDEGNSIIRYNNLWNNELGGFGPDINDVNVAEFNICFESGFLDEFGHLNYTSPCIGAGDPNFAADGDETDIDGEARIRNVRTDIGADEAAPVWDITSNRQYDDIQSAVSDANYGDVVIATRGGYFETINIGPNSIHLRSLSPQDWGCVDETIIDGDGSSSAVVTFSGSEDANCVLEGFTITNGNNAGAGGGVTGNSTGATISFCRIEANTAGQGGGIGDFDGLIRNCKIFDNYGSSAGGGLYGCDGQIINCFIADNNTAGSGGGLYDCNAAITNNTIAANNAGVSGGGLYNCQNTITNCIIRSNTAPDGAGVKLCSEPNYSCLQTAGSGTGNIYTDPLFIDANNSDRHLSIYSDCIDAGDNSAVTGQSISDIDDEQRVFIFDDNAAAEVDIGADEAVTMPADFNDDGQVNGNDLSSMLDEWLKTGADLLTELTGDELVNLADYALLAGRWQWKAPWYRAEKQSALKFESTSDGYVWVHTPEGCILNNVYTFTYTAWIYPLGFNQSNARIIGKNERALMTRSGGVLVGYSNGFRTAQSASVPGALQRDKWQFVVMTRSIETDYKVRLYVNAEEVSYQQQFVAGVTTHPHPDWRAEGEWDLMIGSMAWYPGTYIPDAIIDEVGIYDRVLTGEEMEYLYNNGFGRPTTRLNPIGLWHMDDRQGSGAGDSSGNNNDGLLQGSTVPVWTDGQFLKY